MAFVTFPPCSLVDELPDATQNGSGRGLIQSWLSSTPCSTTLRIVCACESAGRRRRGSGRQRCRDRARGGIRLCVSLSALVIGKDGGDVVEVAVAPVFAGLCRLRLGVWA